MELNCAHQEKVRVNRKTLEAVIEQCQLALKQFAHGCDDDGSSDDINGVKVDVHEESTETSIPTISDIDNDEFYGLLQSRVESADFLKKLESVQASISQKVAEESCSSWDMVTRNDLWDAKDNQLQSEDYVLVRQEDIAEGIAAFMATYLLSLEQSKDLAPNKLQEALSKTFSMKKKGKLRKAWDGTKVVYNVASSGATAIGMYQNPLLFSAASTAFWTSYGVISKLL